MFNIFKGKKKQETKPILSEHKPNLDKSAARLVDRSRDLKLRLEKIELELKCALEAYRYSRSHAEKLRAKKKAVDVLKRKKMFTAQLHHLEQTSLNIENVSLQAEVARDNLEILRILKQTNDMQKQIMKEINVETVDDIIDEMQEANLIQEEFSDVFQRNYEIDLEESELDDGSLFILIINSYF